MREPAEHGSIVVGIDGSKSAMRAALWAVDEAVSRDVPLCLLYAIERGDQTASRRTAETALGRVGATIEATGRPVTIETEIAAGTPVASLLNASGPAVMVCVGAVGMRHFRPGRVGSTAATLATSARCPVAIVRGHDNREPAQRIVVALDGAPDDGALLDIAMKEAQLRNAAVRAIVGRRPISGHTDASAAECDRRALIDLERRRACLKRRYPSVEVQLMAVRGGLVDYLADNRASGGWVPGLVIFGARNRQLEELVGPIGSGILQGVDCSFLIANRQHL
jgi:nucleotide-binding universal stress UspA family protein